MAIGLAVVMLYSLRWIVNAFGSSALDNFPLFPFTVIGGFLVQLALSTMNKESIVDRRSVNDISGLALDS